MTQSQLLWKAIEILERLGVPYALVGSLASSTLGEPRYTNDIDLLVDLDVFDTARLCDAFEGEEYYCYKPTAIEETIARRQFNVLHLPTSNKIDFMIVGDSAWSRQQLNRRRQLDLPGIGPCYVAAAEDIILGKLLYYRDGGSEKHIRDITGILLRSGDSIDCEYLQRFVGELDLQEEWRMIEQRLAER